METLTNRFDVAEMADKLEVFKAEIYFPSFSNFEEMPAILDSLSKREFVKNIHPSDASEYLVQIASYALGLLMQENRYTAYLNWCEANLKQIVGRNLSKSGGFTFAEKDLDIRSHDDIALHLEAQKLLAQTKLDTIRFLSQKLSMITDSLKTLIYEKNRYRKDMQ